MSTTERPKRAGGPSGSPVTETGPVGARAVAPVCGQVGADDLGVVGLEVLERQPQLGRHVAAQIAGERIGGPDQVVQDGPAFVATEIDGHALLVAIEAVKKLAVAGREEVRPHGARHVAALRRVLDLDDLGALVGQEHGAERPGAVPLDGQHPDPFERQHGRYTGFRSTSCRAMMRRCSSLVPSPMASSGASR